MSGLFAHALERLGRPLSHEPPGEARLLAVAPGLALTAALAAAAIELGRYAWFQSHGISALSLAIVLGIAVGNLGARRIEAPSRDGVDFSKQNLLRLGIVLYGLRLTFQDIGQVGIAGVSIDALVLCSTFLLSCFVGTRVFGLDRRTAMLIGAGSSICGAAAVMAAEPVVRGRAEQVTVAVSTVVVFGTLAIFVHPALYHFSQLHPAFSLSERAYGLFAGSTIHEVAQVVAAGHAVGDQAADTAVIAKMVRVMMLAPFLIVLSAWLSRSTPRESEPFGRRKAPAIAIPWFAFGFVAVAGIHSLAILPQPVVAAATGIDNAVLAMAMAGLGLSTRFAAIRSAGLKPLALAALLFVWLVVGGFAINAGVTALLA